MMPNPNEIISLRRPDTAANVKQRKGPKTKESDLNPRHEAKVVPRLASVPSLDVVCQPFGFASITNGLPNDVLTITRFLVQLYPPFL